MYLSPDSVTHFVFLSTRKRIRLRVIPELVATLEWFDGEASLGELQDRFTGQFLTEDANRPPAFLAFANYLFQRGILVEKEWMTQQFPDHRTLRYSRQLNFLLDTEETTEKAAAVFRRIMNAKIAIFGVGAVGSWIVKELVAMGFRRFVIVDPKPLRPADATRNAFYQENMLGASKAEVARSYIRSEAIDPEVEIRRAALDIDTEIESLIGTGITLIINTADEPYIGATSIKLSRYCVTKKLPLLVAGGFDAHLGCLSEMIIPGVTPCADCYATHFEAALQDWKPAPHPVDDRRFGFGGLCSLAIFSASVAALKVYRFFATTSHEDTQKGRGEFLFDNYRIDSFEVARNPTCPTCSSVFGH